MAAARHGASAGLAVACLAMAVCALVFAGRHPVGVRTQVLVHSRIVVPPRALRRAAGALCAVRGGAP